ncbi:MAG TPA: hypothetical protein VIW67_18465, partial [Terriglobales bacterium]
MRGPKRFAISSAANHPHMETIEQPSTCCDSAISSGSAVALKRTAFRTALYPTIIRNKPLLRVGVMLDDWTVPAWVA